MPYQLIEKRNPISASADPAVTVTRDSFFFNKAARDAYDMADFAYVEVFGDPESGKVGLRLLGEPTLNARKLQARDGKAGLNIGAQQVVRFLGMAPGRYPLAYNKQEGLLEFTYQRQGGAEAAAAETDPEEQPRRRRTGGRG